VQQIRADETRQARAYNGNPLFRAHGEDVVGRMRVYRFAGAGCRNSGYIPPSAIARRPNEQGLIKVLQLHANAQLGPTTCDRCYTNVVRGVARPQLANEVPLPEIAPSGVQRLWFRVTLEISNIATSPHPAVVRANKSGNHLPYRGMASTDRPPTMRIVVIGAG
jgi:hypothetical protein